MLHRTEGENKIGLAVLKRRAGQGRGTPRLIVMTEASRAPCSQRPHRVEFLGMEMEATLRVVRLLENIGGTQVVPPQVCWREVT